MEKFVGKAAGNLMKKAAVIVFASLFAAAAISAQRTKPPEPVELSAITQRGRMLAEYDMAAWHSTDLVVALKPQEGEVSGYVARKVGNVWIVVYGRLSDKKDKYLIAYEATQQSSPTEFKIQTYEKPKEDSGAFLNAARALETAKAAFTPAERRPYNAAVLPADDGKFFVYLVPAQTQLRVFPLGGDTRFTISGDGTKVLETRQLHKSIIEFKVPNDVKPEMGYHTAVLDDIPEDTDVYHVLAREPKIPEWIVTQKFVYQIAADGTIKYLMTADAFRKIDQKQQ
jgi:hypothetical protein